MIRIYTDGSTQLNGSDKAKGGFGVVVVETNSNNHNDGKLIKVYQNFSSPTTNNREEMKAIIWAYGNYPGAAIYSDSAYCVNTFNTWINSWKRNGWIKADKKVPENLDLIKIFDEMRSVLPPIVLSKVKGHANYKWNNLADALATGNKTAEEVMNERENY
jgi:ribonuclease HI